MLILYLFATNIRALWEICVNIQWIVDIKPIPRGLCHAVLPSWEQRLQVLVLVIQEHLFLHSFLFSSYIPLIWSYAHTSDHIKSLYLPWWHCNVLSFHLFCSHDSSLSQLELIFVSPILNTWTKLPLVTYISPTEAICISTVSVMKAQMDLLPGVSFSAVDLLNPLPRFLVLSSLPGAGMRENHLCSQ